MRWCMKQQPRYQLMWHSGNQPVKMYKYIEYSLAQPYKSLCRVLLLNNYVKGSSDFCSIVPDLPIKLYSMRMSKMNVYSAKHITILALFTIKRLIIPRHKLVNPNHHGKDICSSHLLLLLNIQDLTWITERHDSAASTPSDPWTRFSNRGNN